MAVTKSFGYTDTTTATKSLVIPSLNYVVDFSQKTTGTPSEVILNNLTCPLDQPETLRYAISNIKDVYDGTGIEPSYRSVSRRGVSLVVQLRDVLRIGLTEADAACCDPGIIDFPLETHIVFRVPVSQYIDADTVLTVFKRNVSGVFDTNGVTSKMLNGLLRGSLNPRLL